MSKRIFSVIVVTILTAAAMSCTKDPVVNPQDYLRFSNAHVHITNKAGAKGTVMVESNTGWQLALEAPVPNWVTLDKLAGSNSESLVVTAMQDNTTGGYKFATVIATPVNNSAIQPVRLTIVQYDSTYKANK